MRTTLNDYLMVTFFLTTVFAAAIAIQKDFLAARYNMAFQEVRASNESLLRTVGRGVNEAYTCRKK